MYGTRPDETGASAKLGRWSRPMPTASNITTSAGDKQIERAAPALPIRETAECGNTRDHGAQSCHLNVTSVAA